ncbi:MAG: flippase-like domain-containing protein [Deltaproteobacteria bacterium]|nr:flippase-like domain-containing protein [Deltaproteobacteria bacterium]
MKKTASMSLFIGLAVSIAALYLAFRQVPFGDLMAYLKSINYLWVIPTMLLALAGFMLRVYRWQLILESSQPVGFWQAFHPLMIGFMLNCILPGRVGEVARPVILNQKEKVPFSTGLATVAAERVFDAIILLLLLSWMLTVVRIDPVLEIHFSGYILNKTLLLSAAKGFTRLSLLLLAGIVLVGLESSRNWMNRWFLRVPKLFFFTGPAFQDLVYQRFSLVLVRFTLSFSRGFLLLKEPWKMAGCFALSLLIWGLNVLSYYTMTLGAPGVELSFAELSVVMVIVCLFISIPSAPGFWGIWEAGGVFALALFGVSAKDAAGFTLANHAVQMLPVIVVGMGSAIVTGVNVWQVSRQADR